MSNELIGLFPISYEIGTGLPGAPLFTLHLVVNTPARTVNGAGLITQTTNPPLNEATVLHGDFTHITVMPKNTHILVTATGHAPIRWPAHGGIGPVLLPNVHLRMLLANDWKTGTANYEFIVNGKSHDVNDAPVKAIAIQQATGAAK